ncbi:hypothetical protein ACFYR1_34395 [Streptomyces canus]|uniref:hypothetical protein n=1 Tax=Streptomyces canus TaxID=58343 RepID=UPI0036B9AC36
MSFGISWMSASVPKEDLGLLDGLFEAAASSKTLPGCSGSASKIFAGAPVSVTSGPEGERVLDLLLRHRLVGRADGGRITDLIRPARRMQDDRVVLRLLARLTLRADRG